MYERRWCYCCAASFITMSMWLCAYCIHRIIKIENHPSHLSFTQEMRNENYLLTAGFWWLAKDAEQEKNDSRFWVFWHLNAAKVKEKKEEKKSFMKMCWTLKIDCVRQHFNIPLFFLPFSLVLCLCPNIVLLERSIHNIKAQNLTRMIKEKCLWAHIAWDEMCRYEKCGKQMMASVGFYHKDNW